VHVLVATTVIEVGVDVPNASLMVIEHAERFGLSQLHQLRGRVGRGSAASVCLLLYQSPLGQVAKQRLMTMRETTDGFEIARRDLEIRGPGEFLGARQSGRRCCASPTWRPTSGWSSRRATSRPWSCHAWLAALSSFLSVFAACFSCSASALATAGGVLESGVVAGAGVWANAAVANRPAIRAAMVFFMMKSPYE
jgi:hypothetical protein